MGLITAAELPPLPSNPSPARPGVEVIATEPYGPSLQLTIPPSGLGAAVPFSLQAGFTAGVDQLDLKTMRLELAVGTEWRNLTDQFLKLATMTPQGARAQSLRLPESNHLLRVSI